MEKDLKEELKLPNDLLREMQYENFHSLCKRFLEYDDDEIKAVFKGRKCNVEDLRKQYRRWLELITPEEFNRQKRDYEFYSRVRQGNGLFKEEKYPEALRQLEDALDILSGMENKAELTELECDLISSVTLIHMKMGRPEQVVRECNKVVYALALDVS